MTSSLVLIEDQKEKAAKRQLKASITRKKRHLVRIMERVGILAAELELIRNEYSVRVGRLYLKDNELDLQIIRYNNILEYLRKGMSPAAALAAVDDTYYAEEIDEIKRRRDAIDEEEKMLIEEEELIAKDTVDFRKLWRELLFKFHPDLATTEKEKNERAEIMKKINDAYRERDIEALRAIDRMHIHISVQRASVRELEDHLAEIENRIMQYEIEYETLKDSEWYTWRTEIARAKRRKTDPFQTLEKRLLDDIVKKVEVVTKLREQLWARKVYTA